MQVGASSWNTAFSQPGRGGNRDDGWYLDDVNFRGLSSTAITLTTDNQAHSPTCPLSNCSSITARFTGSDYITRTNGLDDDVDGTTDETDEGKFTTVSSDAPLRNIDLNGADTANPTTSNCINGVVQYRYFVDADFNGTFNASVDTLIRDFSENPRATAASACAQTIQMDARCSSLTSCTNSTNLAVTLAGWAGTPLASFNPDEITLSWLPVAGATYDVASNRITTTGMTPSSWNTTFTGIHCQANNQPGNTFNTTGVDVPDLTHVSIWLVRASGTCSTWSEPGGVVNRNALIPCP
jgi:hypothetical protein